MAIELKVKKLESLASRTRGLIGTHSPTPVYFKTRLGIHTFFMKFPLDIVITDNRFMVVKTKKSLQPNRIFIWYPKYSRVFELPVGTINKEMIIIGTSIKISE